MSDESFASNASGVAMQYKLAGLNYKTSVKEALFKKGLLRRIELISNIINITSNESIDIIKDVDIKFTRNTIDNLSETADLVNKLSNLISKETALELLKDIIDPEQEKERVQQEREANMALMQKQMTPKDDKDDVKSEDVKDEQIEEDDKE
jgi:SPP1 family phage portal protein